MKLLSANKQLPMISLVELEDIYCEDYVKICNARSVSNVLQ